jgi:hypothetical protein
LSDQRADDNEQKDDDFNPIGRQQWSDCEHAIHCRVEYALKKRRTGLGNCSWRAPCCASGRPASLPSVSWTRVAAPSVVRR